MLEWINDKRRWNDLGHVFFQFMLYTCLPYHGTGNLIICGIVIFAIELFQAKGDPKTFIQKGTLKDIATHALGATLAHVTILLYFLQ